MIAIASDHAGYALKEHLKAYLAEKGIETLDFGCESEASVDYPVYAKACAEWVAAEEGRQGILVCGTGIGISIAANKVKGIRAANCTNTTMARLCREHNNANILAMGARIVGSVLAEEMADTFLTTDFSTKESHHRRVAQMADMEK